jgi:hypothetical protein
MTHNVLPSNVMTLKITRRRRLQLRITAINIATLRKMALDLTTFRIMAINAMPPTITINTTILQ